MVVSRVAQEYLVAKFNLNSKLKVLYIILLYADVWACTIKVIVVVSAFVVKFVVVPLSNF